MFTSFIKHKGQPFSASSFSIVIIFAGFSVLNLCALDIGFVSLDSDTVVRIFHYFPNDSLIN